MPTADSFFALGMGNGFPFCPTKVDVTEVDSWGNDVWQMWSTIDGYNKDTTSARTAAGIAESRRLAMLYVWNLYEITGVASASSTSIASANSEDHGPNEEPFPPKSRVCLGNKGFENKDDFYNNDGFQIAYLLIHSNLSITAMYEGSTSDENNFIGYGIGTENLGGIESIVEDITLLDYAFVELKWFGFESDADCYTDGEGDTYCTIKRDSQYTSLSMGVETFHGVGVAEAVNLYSPGLPSVDGSALSASSSITDFVDDFSISASLSSLTAYTY